MFYYATYNETYIIYKTKNASFFSAFRNIFLSAVVQTRRYTICYAFCDAEMRLLR